MGNCRGDGFGLDTANIFCNKFAWLVIQNDDIIGLKGRGRYERKYHHLELNI